MTGPRAIYVVTGVVLAAVAALSVATYRATERDVISSHTAQQTAIAQTVAVALETKIDALALSLRQFSALPSVQINDPVYVAPRIAAAFASDPVDAIREVVRIDASGRRFGWTVHGEPTVVNEPAMPRTTEWAWFAHAANTDAMRLSPVWWDPAAPASLRALAVPVWRVSPSAEVPVPDDGFAGLLAFVVDLDRLVAVFATAAEAGDTGGSISLVLADGTVAVRRGELAQASSSPPVRSEARMQVGAADWTVRIEAPHDIAVANVRDTAGWQLATIALLMVLVPLVAWALVRRERRVEEERHALHAQLLQAQKMDAIGKLAGGVAHDFNNLLTAILGYTGLILEEVRPGTTIHTEATQVRRAAESAATLTQKLLAFSRRQVLQPQRLDLGSLLGDLQSLLRRLLGEQVQLSCDTGRDLWTVVADPVQMEQVIINLAVNARDAMPGGGTLAISVCNRPLPDGDVRQDHAVRPGDYVAVTVSDVGAGMDEATRVRLFEPFFTTKPKGKGTGLGLSTVYGIVKQSGGYVRIQSAVGTGTTVELLLPRSEAGSMAVTAERGVERQQGGTETILLVEDDGAVRELTQATLERLGYRVVAAAVPSDAIVIAREYAEPIALLLSDVVMPGMLGPEMARHIKALRPGIRVLFMSGYAADAVTGDMLEEAALLQKPFSSAVLTRAVRLVLDASETVDA